MCDVLADIELETGLSQSFDAFVEVRKGSGGSRVEADFLQSFPEERLLFVIEVWGASADLDLEEEVHQLSTTEAVDFSDAWVLFSLTDTDLEGKSRRPLTAGVIDFLDATDVFS